MAFYFFKGLPFRFRQAKVQEHDANATDCAIEEEGAMEMEAAFNVEERLGAEEQEHVAARRGDAPRETARPAPQNKERCISSAISRVYGRVQNMNHRNKEVKAQKGNNLGE